MPSEPGRRDRRALAGVLCLCAVASAGAGVGLSITSGRLHVDVLTITGISLLVAGLGTVLATRARTNPIGWILLGMGFLSGLQTLAAGYADLALLAGRGSETLGTAAAVVAMSLWAPTTLPLFTIVLLLFPDGHLLDPRWRLAVWCAVVGTASVTAFVVLHPDADDRGWLAANPVGLATGSPWHIVLGVGSALLLPALAAAAASLVLRYRRSSGDQRQQLRWAVYGGGIAVPLWFLSGVPLDGTPAGAIGSTVAFALIPVTIVIAILRYRLYDIDRLISRTVAYGVTVVGLAGVYVAAVLGTPLLLPVSLESPITVAGATLLVASLFRPVARKVQGRVDRRFDRRRYDAQRTLGAFAVELRTLVDLDGLDQQLRGVVARTMQPAQVTLWLREEVER